MSRIFGGTRQIAYVVRSLPQAIEYWAGTLGVGPFYVMREMVPEQWRYRGEPGSAPCISLALSFSGGVQVELIEQHDQAPSAYRDFLESGREGFHHLSSWHTPEDYDATRARLEREKLPVAHEGVVPGAGIRFVYYATQAPPGGLYFEMADALAPAFVPVMQRLEAIHGGDRLRRGPGLDPAPLVAPWTVEGFAESVLGVVLDGGQSSGNLHQRRRLVVGLGAGPVGEQPPIREVEHPGPAHCRPPRAAPSPGRLNARSPDAGEIAALWKNS